LKAIGLFVATLALTTLFHADLCTAASASKVRAPASHVRPGKISPKKSTARLVKRKASRGGSKLKDIAGQIFQGIGQGAVERAGYQNQGVFQRNRNQSFSSAPVPPKVSPDVNRRGKLRMAKRLKPATARVRASI
jgi:hypothetical protein